MSLTVTALNGHVAGWPVYFQNVDSSLVAATATDSMGTASAPMAPGGFVSVILPGDMINNSGLVHTFAAVQPGDRLFLGPDVSRRPTIAFDLSFDADPAGGVSGYEVLSTCGFASIPRAAGTVTFAGWCAGTADILILAHRSGGLLDEAYHPGIAVADGRAVALVDTFAPVPTTSYTYTNVPAGQALRLVPSLRTQRGALWTGDPVFLSASQRSVTISTPVTADGTCVIETDLTAFSGQGCIEWGPCGTSYNLDVAAVGLREPATPPSYDAGSGAVVWTEGSSGAVPNVVLASRYGRRDNTIPASWTWIVAAPRGDEMKVAFPRLPTDVFDYNPEPGDFIAVSLHALLIPGGYDAFRKASVGLDYTTLVSGTSGRILSRSM